MDKTFAREEPSSTLLEFDISEDGVMEETNFSIARRINDLFGFDISDVSLKEGDGLEVTMLGRGFRVFTAVSFVARGLGWWTDFRELDREPELDKDE